MRFLFISNANGCLGTEPAAAAVLFHFVAAQLPNCWINLTLKTIVLLKNVTVELCFTVMWPTFSLQTSLVCWRGMRWLQGLPVNGVSSSSAIMPWCICNDCSVEINFWLSFWLWWHSHMFTHVGKILDKYRYFIWKLPLVWSVLYFASKFV